MATENQTSGTAGAASDQELAKPSAARVASGAAETSVTEKPANQLSKAEGLMVNARDFFKQYQEAMAPGKALEAKEGIEMQTRLWRILKDILKLTGTDFIDAYRETLAWIKQNRSGCMYEKYAYRFLAHLVTLQAKDRIAFERMIAFMMVTSDPATRKQVYGRYDTRYVYQCFDGTDVEAKLVEFYNL